LHGQKRQDWQEQQSRHAQDQDFSHRILPPHR
jgi:hypothetical protein